MMECCNGKGRHDINNHIYVFIGFMRYFLIGINLLFALLGLALMGIGSYALVEVKQINVRIRPFV